MQAKRERKLWVDSAVNLHSKEAHRMTPIVPSPEEWLKEVHLSQAETWFTVQSLMQISQCTATEAEAAIAPWIARNAVHAQWVWDCPHCRQLLGKAEAKAPENAMENLPSECPRCHVALGTPETLPALVVYTMMVSSGQGSSSGTSKGGV